MYRKTTVQFKANFHIVHLGKCCFFFPIRNDFFFPLPFQNFLDTHSAKERQASLDISHLRGRRGSQRKY